MVHPTGPLQGLQHFYLGSSKGVQRRSLGRVAFYKFYEIFRNGAISNNTKIVSFPQFCCEPLAVMVSERQRTDTIEILCWKKQLPVS